MAGWRPHVVCRFHDPPFGISCFVIKATIDDPSISLNDVFMGALPFAAVMLVVLVLLIVFPQISLALL